MFFDWLAGFIDGEGCFVLRRTGPRIYPQLTIEVRIDDSEILYEIVNRTGCGAVTFRTRPRGNPQARWMVSNLPEAVQMVGILDAHPLRAKKRRDYDLWREVVLAKNQAERGQEDRPYLLGLQERLNEGRKCDLGRDVGLL